MPLHCMQNLFFLRAPERGRVRESRQRARKRVGESRDVVLSGCRVFVETAHGCRGLHSHVATPAAEEGVASAAVVALQDAAPALRSVESLHFVGLRVVGDVGEEEGSKQNKEILWHDRD